MTNSMISALCLSIETSGKSRDDLLREAKQIFPKGAIIVYYARGWEIKVKILDCSLDDRGDVKLWVESLDDGKRQYDKPCEKQYACEVRDVGGVKSFTQFPDRVKIRVEKTTLPEDE